MKYIKRKSSVKLSPITGSIVDTTNITDKKSNTYSARIFEEMLTIATNASMPVGSGIDFFGTTPPENYMFADGRAISRTEYSELFSIIGTTYGAGDGSTTFNLPDKRERVAISAGGEDWYLGKTGGSIQHSHTQASTTGATTLTTNQIPAHTHGSRTIKGWFRLNGSGITVNNTGIATVRSADGAVAGRSAVSVAGHPWIATSWNSSTYNSYEQVNINATHSHDSVGGGGSHTHSLGSTNSAYALPPYLVCNYIIKVKNDTLSAFDVVTEMLGGAY